MAKYYFIYIFIIALIGGCLLKCENIMHDDGKEPPRIYFFDPRINQEAIYYTIGDSAFIRVIDKPKLCIGDLKEYGNVHAILKTQLGDVESIPLFWIGSYSGQIFFPVDRHMYALFESRGYLIHGSKSASPHNGIIETYSIIDTLTAEYLSTEGKFRKTQATARQIFVIL